MAEAATGYGSGEIATTITGVAAAASQSTEVVGEMGGALDGLASPAAGLRQRVERFTADPDHPPAMHTPAPLSASGRGRWRRGGGGPGRFRTGDLRGVNAAL